MVVAEEQNGELVVLDRIREMVRLGEGLDDDGNLDSEVEQRALDCLSRFGQRIRSLSQRCVSTVGTNTLRRTNNAAEFLRHAEEALGFPIEIISGVEEARLIYQGVAHTLEQDERRNLIVDIGGGSTELIIGEGFTPQLMHSLEMGCVMISKKFFADGKIKEKSLQAARIYVLQRMKSVHYLYRRKGWDVAIGSSGSIKSITSVIQQMALQEGEGISRSALTRLLAICSDYKTIDSLDLPGLSERRRPVFIGGLVVLAGVFESLGIEQMQFSQGALREGLLYDMLGRRYNRDIRNSSIESLSRRFHTDQAHVERVTLTAFDFFQQLKPFWFRKNKLHAKNLLRWACESHEIGRDISHSAYQVHGAYIIQNADLAGFSRQEQYRVAAIIHSHRGKILKDNYKQESHKKLRQMLIRLTIVLRLSVIFHRSRVENALPMIELSADKTSITLRIPDQWLEEHPLTINDLENEANYLANIGISLHTERTPSAGQHITNCSPPDLPVTSPGQ